LRTEIVLHVLLNLFQIISEIMKDILYLHGISSQSPATGDYYNGWALQCQTLAVGGEMSCGFAAGSK
ncbi:MAG: hypothetical protein L7F78_19060, partial [Syntrophales bacterium LBB04]|nr:hypothetical protein [Syntrophales bacterium LBB04]